MTLLDVKRANYGKFLLNVNKYKKELIYFDNLDITHYLNHLNLIFNNTDILVSPGETIYANTNVLDNRESVIASSN